jgi:hypothetical protein
MENFCTPLQCRVDLSMFPHLLPLRFGTQVPNMICIMMVQNLKVAYLKFFAPWVVKGLMSLPSTMEKNFSLNFKRYNLTIREVNFCETFWTCSCSSLGQDITFKSVIFFFFFCRAS